MANTLDVAHNIASSVPVMHDDESVDAFMRRHNLTGPASQTVELLATHFAISGPVRLSVEIDPEVEGESWLEFGVAAIGEVDAVAAAHHRFSRDWIRQIPQQSRDRMRLVLSVA